MRRVNIFLIMTHVDGLLQERRNSIANAPELRFLALTHRSKIMYDN